MSSSSSSVRVRVYYQSEVEELSLSSSNPSMADLRAALIARFSLPPPSSTTSSSSPSFHVGYLDDEADFVRMSTDEELTLFLLEQGSRLHSNESPLHLTVVNVATEDDGDDRSEELLDSSEGSESFVRVEASDFQSDPTTQSTHPSIQSSISPTSIIPPRVISSPSSSEATVDPLDVPRSSVLDSVKDEESVVASPLPLEEVKVEEAQQKSTSSVASSPSSAESSARSSLSPLSVAPPPPPPSLPSPPRVLPIGAPTAAPLPPSPSPFSATFAALTSHPLYPVVVGMASHQLRRLTWKRLLKRGLRLAVLGVVLCAAFSSYFDVRALKGVHRFSFQLLRGDVQELRHAQRDAVEALHRRVEAVDIEQAHLSKADFLTVQRLTNLEERFHELQHRHFSLHQAFIEEINALKALVEAQQRIIDDLQWPPPPPLMPTLTPTPTLPSISIAAVDVDEARERQRQRETKWSMWASPERRHGGKEEEDEPMKGKAGVGEWEQRKSARSERAERRSREKRAREEERAEMSVFPFSSSDPLQEVEHLYNPKPNTATHSPHHPKEGLWGSSHSPILPSSSPSPPSSTSSGPSFGCIHGGGGAAHQWSGGRKKGHSISDGAYELLEDAVKEAEQARMRVENEVKASSKRASRVGRKIGKAVEQVNAAAKRVWKAWENMF